MHTTKRQKKEKMVVEAPKPRNLELHNARFASKAGRMCEKNRKARGAERLQSLREFE